MFNTQYLNLKVLNCDIYVCLQKLYFPRSCKNENNAICIKNLILILLILFIIFLTGCPSPTPDNDDPVTSLSAPDKPETLRDGSDILLTWTVRDKADLYRIFRKIGNGTFFPVPGSDTSEQEWTDTSVPDEGIVQYAVMGISGSIQSPLSPPSTAISNLVQGARGGLYERTDGIDLIWALHPESPESYKIYRYTAKNAPPDEVFAVTGNTYFDAAANTDGPDADRAYFYKITWVKTGVEYGLTAPHVLGIYGSTIDNGEPNNEYMIAKLLTLGNPPLGVKSFSFDDGADGAEADIDWYRYTGPSDHELFVTLNLPMDTPFDSGELKFHFFYNGTTYVENTILLGENTFPFSDFGEETGDIDLYFKVYPIVSSTASLNGSYTIAIDNQL